VKQVYINAVLPYHVHGLSSAEIKVATQTDPVLQKLAAIILTQKWDDLDSQLSSYKHGEDAKTAT
jgi:hypothetical protein